MARREEGLFKPSEDMRDLQFLEELEKNPTISQRELSKKFNIALGVTNACIKKLARKGWVKIRGLNHRQIYYHLTSEGLGMKAKLTLKYLAYNVKLYTDLKNLFTNKLLQMQNQGIKRVVFYGVGDEMEVAYVTLQGVNLDLVGIVDDREEKHGMELFGFKVQKPETIPSQRPDGVLVTSLTDADRILEELKQLIDINEVHLERL
ncbi:MAG: winged helix-turn-helix transcriptional regulator [Candidatus Hodarchaeota archaeon]